MYVSQPTKLAPELCFYFEKFYYSSTVKNEKKKKMVSSVYSVMVTGFQKRIGYLISILT